MLYNFGILKLKSIWQAICFNLVLKVKAAVEDGTLLGNICQI